jgi:hypothetical protein
MLMMVVGMSMECCRADAGDVISETEGEGTCGPSPVNRACGAVLHFARKLAALRPRRR